MIKDSIDNIDLYSPISERISRALHYLGTVDAAGFEEKTVQIDGDYLYAMHQAYTTESATGRFYENHTNHIDVQFVLDGTEIIRVTDVRQLISTSDYDSNDDVTLYEYSDGTDVKLGAGDFVILFPHDAHVPKLESGSPVGVKKIVLKVRV